MNPSRSSQVTVSIAVYADSNAEVHGPFPLCAFVECMVIVVKLLQQSYPMRQERLLSILFYHYTIVIR